MLGGPYRKTLTASTKANHMTPLDWKSPFRPLFLMLSAGLTAGILAACSPSQVSADPQLAALVQKFSQFETTRLPEEADMLGLSPEAFGWPYNDLLDDRSMAQAERTRTTRLDFLRQFELIDRTALSRDAQRTY